MSARQEGSHVGDRWALVVVLSHLPLFLMLLSLLVLPAPDGLAQDLARLGLGQALHDRYLNIYASKGERERRRGRSHHISAPHCLLPSPPGIEDILEHGSMHGGLTPMAPPSSHCLPGQLTCLKHEIAPNSDRTAWASSRSITLGSTSTPFLSTTNP